MIRRIALGAGLYIALLLGPALAACEPNAATGVAPGDAFLVDPPRDAEYPAANRQLLVQSYGSEMNALFFLAAGAGPKPTAILLHGLPGNERNLDLAQAMRRAGWNVLTFTYRGAWGSTGAFSIAHAIEDARAALAFVRSVETVATYSIDTHRIVLVGHSMGGLAAVLAGVGDKELAGTVLLDAWDAGATAAKIRAGGAKARAALVASFDDLGHALKGATAETLADEIIASSGWRLSAQAPDLASRPLLTVYASEGMAEDNRALAAAVAAQSGARVQAVELATDHSFADHRIALSAIVVRWLGALE